MCEKRKKMLSHYWVTKKNAKSIPSSTTKAKKGCRFSTCLTSRQHIFLILTS